MKKTGITEIIGYGQMVGVWAIGLATWYVATDLESVTGKLETLKVLATMAGVGTVVVGGRKAYTEASKYTAQDNEPEYKEGSL